MKFNFDLQLANNANLNVTEDSLKLMSAGNQTLAIIANALNISNPISTFTSKEGKLTYFVSKEVCQQILQKLAE
jgi:hypothetical protein